MNHIIAEPDEQSNLELKKALDDYEELDFRGGFMTFEAAKKYL